MEIVPTTHTSQIGQDPSKHIDILFALTKYSKDHQQTLNAKLRRYLIDYMGQSAAELSLSRIETVLALRMVDSRNVLAYLNILKNRGARQATAKFFRQAVIFLANHLADLELLPYSQVTRLRTVDLPQFPGRSRPGIWLNRTQAHYLIQNTRNESKLCPPRRIRDETILLLMIFCGLRCEEVTKVCWNDIFHQGPRLILRIHGKGSKTRFVSLPPNVQNALHEWKAISGSEGPVFRCILHNNGLGKVRSRALGKDGIYEIVRDAGRRIGIPTLGPHDLRRTCARLAYEAGAPIGLIQQQLGHSSVKTTERYINPLLTLEQTATDVVATEFGDDLKDVENDGTSVAPTLRLSDNHLLTRQEAASYLKMSPSQFDRWSKKVGLTPAKRISGKTRPFNMYRQTDLDNLRFN